MRRDTTVMHSVSLRPSTILRLPDGRDRIVRRADGRDHARRGSLNRWHQEPSSDKFLVMCRHLECWQPRCQRRLRLTFFSLRWRSMAE
jgi:hypothetical protein